MAVVDTVRALVVPILDDLGLALYDVEHLAGRLVVTIEREGGVDLDTIALATRLISRELDHADPLPGRYQLEVTSPGLERALRTPDHFRRAVGQTVSVRLHAPVEGTRRLQGALAQADDTGIVVQVDDPDGGADSGSRRVPYVDIERARTVFVWGPTPRPGRPDGGGSRGKKRPSKPAAAAKARTPAGAARPTSAPTETEAS